MKSLGKILFCLFMTGIMFNVSAHSLNNPGPVEQVEQVMPFTVYPNPLTTNKLVVNIGFSMQASDVTFSISNVLGQTVYQHKLTQKDFSTGTFTADLSSIGLERGIYLMKMTMDGKTNVQKLVVK